MFIRYNEALDFWEYDTSASQTGAGPWVLLPIDASKLIGGVTIPPNIAFTNANNIFTTYQTIRAGVPYLAFNYIGGGVDGKNSRFEGVGDFKISHTNDADNVYLQEWRFQRNGNTIFPGAINAAGAVFGSSLNTAGPVYAGQGYQFATTQVSSSNPNQLDDYEEGNWDPALYSATGGGTSYAVKVGTYTKIGNLVCCFFDWIILAGNWTVGTDAFYTLSLPFICDPSGPIIGSLLSYYSGLNGSVISINTQLNPGYNHFMYNYKSAASSGIDGTLVVNNLQVNTRMVGNMIYRTTT